MTQSVLDEFVNRAEQYDEEIKVDISYRIINQVSSQLYTNPRRAIEELVCNSYDAGASDCWVRSPEPSDESLYVLDNGRSMDFDGLDWLWTVAESPKVGADPDRIESNRKQIGKFGVGKLAAYALGKELTHIAHKDGTTRVITVSEEKLSDVEEDDQKPSFPVNYMEAEEASDVLEPYFSEIPNPYAEGWDSWTLAVVSSLHEDSDSQALKASYLDQMIKTAIPISSDFKVRRDGKALEPREPSKDTIYSVDITSDEFVSWFEDDLRSFWGKRLELDDSEDVDKSQYSCSYTKVKHYSNTEETVDALSIPNLGPVYGDATIFSGTITSGKREERGFQDHGFKVTVKGKHLNRHDPLFGVSQRSHKYWNRFFAEIEAPGLDEAILVQRNDVNENSIETLITRRLLKSLFNYCRVKTDDLEESEEYRPKSFGERLNLFAPFEGSEAIEGLSGEYPGDDLDEIGIKSTSRNEDDRAVLYEDGFIYINEEHPYFKALSEERGYRNFKEGIAEAIAGHLLVKGYLDYQGIEHPILQASDEVYDDVLRSAASYFRDEISHLLNRLDETSYEGDDPFEKTIISAFRTMKLASRHYGESGNPDGVIELPLDEGRKRISIEAKGQKEGKSVDHKVAKVASITRHRDKMEPECHHAVLVARNFVLNGPGGSGDSSLLSEIDREDGLTLIRLDAIKKILELHKEQRFVYSEIDDILTCGVHPEEMISYIQDVWESKPAPNLMRTILDEGWKLQQESDMRPNAGMLVRVDEIQEMDGIETRNDIAEIIKAMAPLTADKVKVYDEGYEFVLDAHPETIMEETAEQEGETAFNSDLSDFE